MKTSRLISRRSLAQEFCDAGLISVNGTTSKSSKEVKVGDEISINRRDRKIVIRITAIPDKKQVSKHTAGDMYELL